MHGSAAQVSCRSCRSPQHSRQRTRWAGPTEAGHSEIYVVEQVEELGAELKFHPLINREIFDVGQVNIEEVWISQNVMGRVVERVDRVDGEARCGSSCR